MSLHCPRCRWRDENWRGPAAGVRCPDCGYVFGDASEEGPAPLGTEIDLGGGWVLSWGDVLRTAEGMVATLYPAYRGMCLWSDRVPLMYASSRHKFAARLVEWAGAQGWAAPEAAQVESALLRLLRELAVPVPPRVEERQESAEERAERLARLEEVARPFLADPEPLGVVAEALAGAGCAGEVRAALLLYLAATARLLPRPVSVLLVGPSAAGKTHLLQAVVSLLPEAGYYWLTGMSRKALQYEREDALVHRIICAAEAPALRGGDLVALRELVWGGQVVFRTATPEGTVTKTLQGPTALFTTATRAVDHELATRLLEVPVADDPAATRAVLLATAARAAGGMGGGSGLDALRAAQEWLQLQQWRVVVPFAPRLAERYPAGAVRARRDFGQLLSVIGAHALLSQARRERGAGGEVVATPGDYRAVYPVVAEVFAEGAQGVPATVRETVAAVAAGAASITEVALRLGIDRSSASRRVARAEGLGVIHNVGSARRARLRPGEPLPAEGTGLPTPEELEDDV